MSLISSLIVIFNIYNSLPKRKMAEVITYHIKSVGLLYYFSNVSEHQGWQYKMLRKNSTIRLNFCLKVRYACTVRACCEGAGTVRWCSV